MGRVQAFQVAGCRCWFYSGDHAPPHFHAGVPDVWEIRVYFIQEPVQFEVIYQLRQIPRKKLKAIFARVVEHRVELFEEWDRHQSDNG